jgi:hypothetical protein
MLVTEERREISQDGQFSDWDFNMVQVWWPIYRRPVRFAYFICLFSAECRWVGFTLTSSTAHDEGSDDVVRWYKLGKVSVEQNLQHDFLILVFLNVCATTVRGLQYCLAGLPHSSYTATSFFHFSVGVVLDPWHFHGELRRAAQYTQFYFLFLHFREVTQHKRRHVIKMSTTVP